MSPVISKSKQAQDAYLQRYLDVFDQDALAQKTIIVYQHSAVGRDMLVTILKRLGANVITTDRSDAFVSIDTENVTPDQLRFFRNLANKYKHKKIFAIISTDGDSDRPFVVDENGQFHRGDVLGIIVSQFLKADFAAVPVSANDAVATQLKTEKIPLKTTRIGSPHVIAAMNKAIAQGRSAVVGWEVNGGFMLGSDITINGKLLEALPTRDAILPIICALLQAKQNKLPLSKLFAQLPQRYTQAGLLDRFPIETSRIIVKRFSLTPKHDIEQINFTHENIKITTSACAQEQQLKPETPICKQIEEIKAQLQQYFSAELGFNSIRAINYTDGIKIIFFNNDIVHIRPSGNSPQLRIYAIADSQTRADEIVKFGIAEDGGVLRRMEKKLITTATTKSCRAQYQADNSSGFLREKPIELKFGTSGLRGFIKHMTDLECYINTKGFIKYLISTNNIDSKATIALAGDLRFSTERIMAAITAAIKNVGCEIANCGKIPSPALAFYAMKNNLASIMVTGSHIPDDQNGIKFNKRPGAEVLKSDEQGILTHIEKIRKQEYARSHQVTVFNENGMFKLKPWRL